MPGLFGDQQLLQFSEALQSKVADVAGHVGHVGNPEYVGQHVKKKQERLQLDGDEIWDQASTGS